MLRALGLGDLLTAVPALRALGEAFPGHRRELAAPPALASLLALLPGNFVLAPARGLEPLPDELHGAGVAVNLHGRGPESHRVILSSGPAELLAFEHPDVSETRGMPRWRRDEHEVDRWCRMLGGFGIAADRSRLEIDRPAPGPTAVPREATLIHPGAASAARRWPAERFAAVARSERRAGRPVVLTGGPDEIELAREVAAAAGLADAALLAGRTTLAELASVVAAAARVLCGDTGIAHLATALGTPSVVLFGPTSPAEWGPPREPAGRHRAVWSGSLGDPHGVAPDPGLVSLTVEMVLSEVDQLPAPPSS